MLFSSRHIVLYLILGLGQTCCSGSDGTQFDILDTSFPDQWIPPSLPSRKDLKCNCIPSMLYEDFEGEKEHCCTCVAEPIWLGQEIHNATHLEFVSVMGTSVILVDRPVNMSTVYKIKHSYASLAELPINICDWDKNESTRITALYGQFVNEFRTFWTRVVVIDFASNKIKAIPNINCLQNLDTLDLSYNEIEHISNTSFNLMSHFRKLHLQRNKIKTMDIAVISDQNVHLWFADFSENVMSSIDVSNMNSRYPFCNMNFRANNMESMTNLGNFTLKREESYGPGFVSFKDNSFHTFPDFQELFNLGSLADLGKLLHFGYDFRNTELDCNCHMELYCELAADVVRTLWRDYFDVKCTAPPWLRGVAVVNVSLSDFVCDLSEHRDCPTGCTCVDQPSLRTVHVDCSNTGQTQLPLTVPESKYSENYNLDMSGNDITVITNVSYLGNVSHLNLSDNALIGIDEAAAGALENTTLDISQNKDFKTIPQNLQHRSMCNLHMNNLQITCDCETSWISSWVSVKGCNETMSFICDVPGHGTMPADQFSKDLLDCSPADPYLARLSGIIGALIVVLGMSAVLLLQFRYEVLILSLRLRRFKKTSIVPSFKYDVFLSFDEENSYLRKWANTMLNPHLQKLGYKTFVPCKDLLFGGVRESETITVLKHTRHFILILSESYLAQNENLLVDNEWRYGWNMYRDNSAKKIIIINYDYISSFDVQHPQIKAYLRAGESIDFTNHQGNIMDTIVAKLGPPCVSEDKFIDNSNVKFNYKIFQAKTDTDLDEENYPMEQKQAPDLCDVVDVVPDKSCTRIQNFITERQRPARGQYKYYV